MKFLAVSAFLASAALASPIAAPEAETEAVVHPIVLAGEVDESIVKRQGIGSTADELENGPCRDITFIFARGSTEPGNLGATVGPATCNALKSQYGSDRVACQGVGFPYIADLASNALPLGTTTAAIGEAQDLYRLAATKCPDTVIVGGGYSQGAAVMTSAVGTLPSEIEDRIVGVVLYGDTRNLQTLGSIPGYPRSNTLVICLPGDGVCTGTLLVTPAHLLYVPTVPRAVRFLSDQIDDAL